MLLLSLGLHLATVFFFAGLLLPRWPRLPRPVCYVDLVNRPVVEPQAYPRDASSHPEPPPRLARPADPGSVALPSITEKPPLPLPPSKAPGKRAEAPEFSAKTDQPTAGETRELGNDSEEVKIGPRFAPRKREERLPVADKLAFGRSAGVDPLPAFPDTGRERYGNRATDPALPPTPRNSLFNRMVEPEPSAATIASRRFQENSAAALPPVTHLRPAAIDLPETPEEPLPPPAPTSPEKAPAAVPKLSAARTSFDFLDRVATADLDRMHLVSLNRLHTCLDPEAEMDLRTRLATLLSRPATCRRDGVVFDIRQPESAWSIHIDIYNYENRKFTDRCAALQLALESCEGARR